MVLAAGLGTRLRPLTLEVPKPLVWLGDRPQLAHVLDSLARAGVERVVMNTHHLPERFAEFVRAGAAPLAIELVHETEILGTAGGVANAARALGPGPRLVVNADIVADFDLRAVEALAAREHASAVLVVGPRRARGEGTVGITADGLLARIRAARRGEEVAGADYAGIVWLGEALSRSLPAQGCLVGDVILPALERGERIAITTLAESFVDVGTPGEYLAANLEWLARRGLRAWVAPDAEVDPRAELRGVIVAPGASVGPGLLEDVVVWPGARAEGPIERAVVTRAGITLVR
ncbi:MAG: sugar phosphate nucleotidyltransferase [Polyangiaceae bacterium]